MDQDAEHGKAGKDLCETDKGRELVQIREDAKMHQRRIVARGIHDDLHRGIQQHEEPGRVARAGAAALHLPPALVVIKPQDDPGQNPEDGDGTMPERTVLDEQGIPLWKTVDESYFDDALFIGDSRVVGLRDYGKLAEHATFYAYEGLNVFRLLTAKIVEVPGQHKKISVEEALGERQFAKIYLMTGINELDIGTVDRFENAYRDVVSRIRELQPGAVIYIQGIMLVTEKRAHKGDFVTNQGILERNEALKTIADWQTIFYLEDNEAITDESGVMNPSYTTDGIHLKAKYVPLWTEYLKTHVLSLD